MKRVLYVLAAALMVCVSSCSKDEQPVKADDVKMVQATISAESSNTGDGTKTVATYDKDTQKYNITWEEGDELSVFNSKNSEMSKFTANSTGAATQFEGEIPEGSDVTYAILPYDKDATVSGSTVYTSIPAEQNGDFYNVVLAGWPKDLTKAATYDFRYQFEAVCGIVKFSFDPERIAEGKTINSITISADRPIAGAAKIVYGGEKPVMSSNPNATGSNVYNVISIVKPEGFSKGDYYFSTFPISVEDNVEGMNISLRFDTSDGNVSYMSATLKSMGSAGNKHIFAANIVKNIGSVKVTGYIPHPFTSGKFTVAPGRQVTFSRGNLQYQASSNTWRFALNQWDAQGEVGNMTQPASDDDGDRQTQSAWIDLFPWGHSGFEYNSTSFVPYHANYIDDQGLYLRSQTGELSGNYANGDWGKFCSIHNGNEVDNPGTWRLLSSDEFSHIAFYRNCTVLDYTQPDNPYNKFKIYFRFLRCGIDTGVRDSKGDPIIRYGVMVFPDEFTWPEQFAIPGVVWEACHIGSKGVKNADAVVYSLSDFAIFEAAGAVFLPSAGQWRHETTGRITLIVANASESTFNQSGYYWTTSSSQSIACYSGNIFEIDVAGADVNIGRSVRLVKDVK